MSIVSQQCPYDSTMSIVTVQTDIAYAMSVCTVTTSAGNVQAVDLQLKYGDTGMEVDLNGIAWCVTLGVLVEREASLARYDFVNNRNKRTLPVTMSMGPGSSAKRFKVM
ncbi:hypothetical protein BC832DRAFT_589682 [Gaertneriomyces semiglobifer]|nr:hypothetical protein BC832DRAFT_595731 [Gaertneriomyces semiglobifer]KAI9015228.1 hypothetical protein BC832DRAFT_589682 [Gaertneriomyces semiglobifer]